MIKQNKAITLIALIVTIVVLLILAGVTINMVMGDNGLINKAKTSVAKYQNAQEKENSVLKGYEAEIDNSRETITISKEELNEIIDERIKQTMSSPKLVLTSNQANSGADTSNARNGSYSALKGSSDFFTNTISNEGSNYIEFQSNNGWKIKKSGFYYFSNMYTHGVYSPSGEKSGDVKSYLYINNSPMIITYNYVNNPSMVVGQDEGNVTLYLEEGDVINFVIRFPCTGVWSYATFKMYALFK